MEAGAAHALAAALASGHAAVAGAALTLMARLARHEDGEKALASEPGLEAAVGTALAAGWPPVRAAALAAAAAATRDRVPTPFGDAASLARAAVAALDTAGAGARPAARAALAAAARAGGPAAAAAALQGAPVAVQLQACIALGGDAVARPAALAGAGPAAAASALDAPPADRAAFQDALDAALVLARSADGAAAMGGRERLARVAAGWLTSAAPARASAGAALVAAAAEGCTDADDLTTYVSLPAAALDAGAPCPARAAAAWPHVARARAPAAALASTPWLDAAAAYLADAGDALARVDWGAAAWDKEGLQRLASAAAAVAADAAAGDAATDDALRVLAAMVEGGVQVRATAAAAAGAALGATPRRGAAACAAAAALAATLRADAHADRLALSTAATAALEAAGGGGGDGEIVDGSWDSAAEACLDALAALVPPSSPDESRLAACDAASVALEAGAGAPAAARAGARVTGRLAATAVDHGPLLDALKTALVCDDDSVAAAAWNAVPRLAAAGAPARLAAALALDDAAPDAGARSDAGVRQAVRDAAVALEASGVPLPGALQRSPRSSEPESDAWRSGGAGGALASEMTHKLLLDAAAAAAAARAAGEDCV